MKIILVTVPMVFICLLANSMVSGFGKTDECGARIDIKVNGSFITVAGYFKNNTDKQVSCSYEMVVKKTGGLNHSSGKQSGKASIGPSAEELLSRTELNVSESEVIEFELRIIQKGIAMCILTRKYSQTTKA